MDQVLWVGDPNPGEVFLRNRQRQVSVWTAPHYAGIRVILTVIFPEADRANFIGPTLAKRAIMATGAIVRGRDGGLHGASMWLNSSLRNRVGYWQADFGG